MEEADFCTDPKCNGLMQFSPVENCRCHFSAPCNACVENPLTCSVCKFSEYELEEMKVGSETQVELTNKVSESIYTSETRVVPMAEVQHIEKLKRSDGKGGMVPNGLFLITKMTTWSREMDMWENPILIPQDESEDFLKAWCFYRYELEASSPSCYGAKSVAAEK